jgi:hypothetical protein
VPIVAADRLERVDLSDSRRAFLARSASFSFPLEIAERSIEVCFDDEEARDAFGSRFTHHATALAPEFRYYVAATNGARYFWSSRSQPWCWPGETTPKITAFLADAAVVSAIVRSDAELLSLHAAVVSHAGRIAAIGGKSWAGKSTTAIACVRQGMQFYSDERLLVRRGTVYPFQRLCTLRPQSRQLLAADGIDDTLDLALRHDAVPDRDWNDVSIADVFGGHRIGRRGPLAAAFVLRGRASSASVWPIPHHEAAPALFDWMDSREGDFKRLAQLIELLGRVPCFALQLGTPKATAAVITKTLEGIPVDGD